MSTAWNHKAARGYVFIGVHYREQSIITHLCIFEIVLGIGWGQVGARVGTGFVKTKEHKMSSDLESLTQVDQIFQLIPLYDCINPAHM